MLTDKLFTGQRQIAELGIYHYQARFYSPKLGRFLSADTIVPSYANPQSLNRFSYVINNPLKYTDPTGHKYDMGEGGGTINYKKYPCGGMKGLPLDICRRGPKKPKTPKEIVKDLVTFFDLSQPISDALSYPGLEVSVPGRLIEMVCQGGRCDPRKLKFVWTIVKHTYPIIATGLAPDQQWLTPSVTPSPFKSPTAEFTPTLITPQNSVISTSTPTPSLTVTPSATPIVSILPTWTSTPIYTPVYWVP
jgi:RHS repeat-associated protein